MYEGGKERVLRLLEVQLVNTPSNLKRITSTALGAWKLGNYDRQTDRRPVTLPIICNIKIFIHQSLINILILCILYGDSICRKKLWLLSNVYTPTWTKLDISR